MRAAVYARFSSENQREQSIEDQVRVCKEFARRDGIAVVESHIYADEARSGAIRARPGLEALKKAAEDRQFDCVLVDDSSRLSRDNQHFNTLLCQFQYWGISLIAVSDGLDTREEHAKVAYQFRGIINELYLTDLKKKTHRGQMGQVLRGYSVGSRGYGYASVPDGDTKYDKKGRLRAEGFKLVVAPEEARIIQRIFRAFIDGKAVTKIAKELNAEKVPTRARRKGGWNVSTVSRILKDEKYIGRFIWNRTTTLKDPLTGKMKQVDRPKEDWVVQEREDIRIISDEEWNAAQARWKEIDGVFPTKRGKKGFESKRKSYVDSHPTHLLSGALKCGGCGCAMGLVSGKGGGYYGCLRASRRACENRKLIARKRLEKQFVSALNDAVLKPEVLDQVFERTAKKVKGLSKHVPEELRLKKVELNRAETRVHNFVEFVASGRATPALADALAEAEEQVKTLSAEVASLESSKDDLFTPPPRAWIENRITELNQLLGKRTEKSALALRRLTGPVTLTQESPEVGRPYFRATCRFEPLNLLHVSDSAAKYDASFGSNLLQWWRRRESNPGPQSVTQSLVHVRSRLTQPTGSVDSATTYPHKISATFLEAHSSGPALVLTSPGYQGYLTV